MRMLKKQNQNLKLTTPFKNSVMLIVTLLPSLIAVSVPLINILFFINSSLTEFTELPFAFVFWTNFVFFVCNRVLIFNGVYWAKTEYDAAMEVKIY